MAGLGQAEQGFVGKLQHVGFLQCKRELQQDFKQEEGLREEI